MSINKEIGDVAHGGLVVYDTESLLSAVQTITALGDLRTQATSEAVRESLAAVMQPLSAAICEYVAEIGSPHE